MEGVRATVRKHAAGDITNVNSGYRQGGAQYRNMSNHFSFSLLFSDFFHLFFLQLISFILENKKKVALKPPTLPSKYLPCLFPHAMKKCDMCVRACTYTPF